MTVPLNPAMRTTGIDLLEYAPWGTHFCLFYGAKKDLAEVTIPFLKAGLDHNEYCLFIASKKFTMEDLTAMIRPVMPNLETMIQEGKIEIILYDQWYLKDGVFDEETVFQNWLEKLDGAKANGFEGLRIVADESWLDGQQWNTFCQYEQKLNHIFANKETLVVCAYPLEGSTAEQMLDVARTHEFAAGKRNDSWDILETPSLKQAKEEILKLNRDLERRIDERTHELKLKTEELQRSKERFLKIFQTSPVGVSITRLSDGKLIEANKAWFDILGYPMEEVIGISTLQKQMWVDPADREKMVDMINRKQEVRDFETKFRAKSGKIRTVSFFAEPIKIEGEQCILGLTNDITERKELETHLFRAQRLENLGSLASGIAHDLNNILGPILLSIQFLKKNLGEDKTGLLTVVEKSVKRGSEIIKQILSFARGMAGERMVIQLRTIMSDLGNVFKETFPKSIHIELDFPKDLWPVLADPTQLDQVLMNLSVNARDAMPNGGKLTIWASNIELDKIFVQQNPKAKPGKYVCITVADSGAGIPQEHLQKIFDPFFTTKDAGKGTGLGLATVLGIVKKHDGLIQVRSEIGRGTEFKIYIPAVESGTDAATAAVEERLLPPGNGELILFVDDEAAFRQIGKTTLESYGYTVLVAEHGVHAISLFHEHQNEIDLLLTDILMPFMDGIEIITTIRKVRSDIKVIAMSGSDAEEKLNNLRKLGDIKILVKPFTFEQLLIVLQETLHKV